MRPLAMRFVADRGGAIVRPRLQLVAANAVDSTRFRVLPNPLGRYLLNEQTHPQPGKDGSLTLYFAAEKPADAPDGNWLPTPKGEAYRLTFRYYGPLDGVANGTYYPPVLMKLK
jgi:hypothetical protein